MYAQASTGGSVHPNGVLSAARPGRLRTRQAEDLDSDGLAAGVASGDTVAFAKLYDRYYARVHAYLFARLKHHQDAEEATQHVFTRALEAAAQFDSRRCAFRIWLFAIARNHAIDLRRRRACDLTDPASLADEQDRIGLHFEDQGDGAGSHPRLGQLIGRLSEHQRQVLVLRYVLNLTPADVAQVLNTSPDAVRHLEQRALVFLRTRLRAAPSTRPRVSPPAPAGAPSTAGAGSRLVRTPS